MAVTTVFQSGQLAKDLKHNFISLVPKKDKPQNISNYCPISYANVLYEIISKIICSRIKDFLPYLIVKNQSAFVPNRSIGENILLAHELVHDFKKKGRPKMCVKIDFQKAYDMANKELFATCFSKWVFQFL